MLGQGLGHRVLEPAEVARITLAPTHCPRRSSINLAISRVEVYRVMGVGFRLDTAPPPITVG